MRYIGIAYPIASYSMLPTSTAIINASVIRPIVAFKKNGVVPVVICGIGVVCILAIVYNVIVENKII